jgi:hypothetical protein
MGGLHQITTSKVSLYALLSITKQKRYLAATVDIRVTGRSGEQRPTQSFVTKDTVMTCHF